MWRWGRGEVWQKEKKFGRRKSRILGKKKILHTLALGDDCH